MNKKQMLIVFCLFIVFISAISVVCATGKAANSTVSMPVNETSIQATDAQENLLEIDSGSFTQLDDKIQQTPTNGTIKLNNNYSYSSGERVGINGIVINKDITIDGDGHTIDGSNRASIFRITDNANVALKNIVFYNAQGTNGAAISFTSNENVLISNCQFIANSASNGAAIYIASADTSSMVVTSSIVGSTFINNRAENGGAIYVGGTFINILSSVFKYNHAICDGGSVYLEAGADIRGSIFEHETADYDGGAIYLKSDVDPSTIDPLILADLGLFNNAISFCSAGRDGGAGYFNASYGYVWDLTLNSNIANRNGGGMLWSCLNSNIVQATVFNNTAVVGDGGGIYLCPPALSSMDDESVMIMHNKFANNTAGGNGGALYCGGEEFAFIINSTFENDTAYDGGGTYLDVAAAFSYCKFDNERVVNDGGAIYLNASKTTISSSNPYYLMFMQIEGVRHSTIADCIAGHDGGACYIYDNDWIVENLTMINNTAYNDGGAGYVVGENGQLSDSTFINNTAGHDGGAVYFDEDATVENCHFINNTASDEGGAAFFFWKGNVTNCSFTDNNASLGGAIKFDYTGTARNCNFTNNSASDKGGAIKFGDDDCDIADCSFMDNKASFGGAVWISQGIVENCDFTNNSASDGDGGALNFRSNGDVTNCNFTDNKAILGGGAIYFNDQYGLGSSVTDCNFVNNLANSSRYGGGAVMFYNDGNVRKCNFTDNSASYGNGGAIYFDDYTSGCVESCIFTDNSASDGGAIYMSSGSVEECTFANNSASQGGAISSKLSTVDVDTCIFKTDSDTTSNTHILPPALNVDDFTTFYGSGEKLAFDLKTNSNNPVTNGNISISVYFKDNDSLVDNYTCLSGEGWTVDLPVGSYYAIFDTEYAEFQPINRTITITMPAIQYYVNVTSLTTNNKTVNITAKSNISENLFWSGKLLFILPNNGNITANYAGNGTWWALHTFDDYAVYGVNASCGGFDNVKINNATITINKANSTLTVVDVAFDYGGSGSTTVLFTGASGVNAHVIDYPNANVSVVGNTITVSGLNAGSYTLSVTTMADADHNNVTETAAITVNRLKTYLTATYNLNKDLAITFKDSKGKALSGFKITVDLNGAKEYVTDINGQIKVSTKALTPKTYTAKITFNGNVNYDKSFKEVKVTVKKATSKITAKNKSFKAKTKTKKYVITLKDNNGKTIKKAKVTVKIGKKTYKAKTNAKGKAVFKIKKLTKKGKYNAIIKYKGNYLYKKATKKVKINIK